ncbi:MAG: ATP-binding cassette domain-containing protein [Alphaproteobacteria bacterium]|nr:ATP-binding cassette domain-containing protein [Rickettsiales bacterium]
MIKFSNFNISSKYKPINLTVELGQIVHITASNKVEERLLFDILSGQSKQYSGEIYINNYPLAYNSNEMKKCIQFISKHQTFYNQVAVGRQLSLLSLRWSGCDLSGSAMKALRVTGLKNIAYSKLTIEERKKIELARLLACPASIWLLEGVDGGFSEEFTSIVRDLILHRVSRNGIVFLTTKKPVKGLDKLFNCNINFTTLN